MAISLGLFFSALGYLLIGPAPFIELHLPDTGFLILVIIALIIMGVGETMILVPAVPFMLQSLQDVSEIKGSDPNDVVAGLFNFAWCVGDFVGPLLGGALTHLMPKTSAYPCHMEGNGCLSGFPWSSVTFAMVLLLPLTLTFTERHAEPPPQVTPPPTFSLLIDAPIRRLSIPEDIPEDEEHPFLLVSFLKR